MAYDSKTTQLLCGDVGDAGSRPRSETSCDIAGLRDDSPSNSVSSTGGTAVWLPAITLTWLQASRVARGEAALTGLCSDFKVHILSYTQVAKQLGLPACVAEDQVVADAGNGIVYVQEDEHKPGAPGFNPDVDDEGRPRLKDVHHSFGTHAAPWLFAEALSNSKCTTPDIDAAQAVYVDLYCPYITWLGQLHHRGREDMTTSPGDDILKVYDAVTALPRWQRHQGRDFIFFDPHPGFAAGNAEHAWLHAWCHPLNQSIQLVVDRAQRHYCPSPSDMLGLVPVPYVGNVINVHRPRETLNHKLPRLEERTTLIYSSARCADEAYFNNGLNFRSAVYKALHGVAPDIKVECTNREMGGSHVSFQDMLDIMEHSVFCLALAGDSPSTRRLSEIFLAGAIPVIVGPPFNALPLSHLIDYSDVGVVFNITGPTPWLDNPHPRWLEIPTDAPASSFSNPINIIQVPDIASIEGHLRDMPQALKIHKLKRMKASHRLMTYADAPVGSWDANSAILATVKGMIRSCCP